MSAADEQSRQQRAGRSSAFAPSYVDRPLNPHRLAVLHRHAGQSYLDVGCGNGGYVRALSTAMSVGLDRQPLDAWTQQQERLLVGDATALPFADASFELVSAFETLEHVPDPALGLDELRRVASRTVVLTVPNCEVSPGQRASGLVFHHWVDPTHLNFWSHDEFVTFVDGAPGWEVVEAERINAIDLTPMILEAFAPQRVRAALLRRALRLTRPRRYPMTTLVVAQRTGS